MIKLYNDDCMNVMKGMPDGSVDCVITDCPYHIVSGGCSNDAVKIARYIETGGILSHRTGNAIQNTKEGKLFDHNDIEFSEWLPEVYRVLKEGTHCYVMINARNLKDLWVEAEKVGFVFQNLLVWDKGNATPNRWYMQAYELILMLRKGKARNINKMGTSNIIRVPNIIRTKAHPTEKPAELMMVLVENSTNEGEVVLDPFMGVGGGGVACKRLNRKFIGIEIDEKYYKIASGRLEEAPAEDRGKQISIFDLIGE